MRIYSKSLFNSDFRAIKIITIIRNKCKVLVYQHRTDQFYRYNIIQCMFLQTENNTMPSYNIRIIF